MGRYGTREAELDDLLRRGVFVDLLKVVRNGLRASRPGYGLKEMEAFLDFERQAEVKDGGASIVIFEQWMQTGEQALLDQIDAYNREDCIATRLLRDWLLELKPQAGPIAPAPPPEEPKPIPERKAERAALAAQLLDAGRGARGAPARLPRPRAQARLVGLLRPDRDDARRARRGRRVDRPGRGRQRPRAGEEVAGVRAQLPRAGAQDRAGAGRARPGDAGQRRRDPRARPRRAQADAEARAVARGRAAARVADPGRPVLDAGSGGRARPLRPLAARPRPPLSRARVGAAARAVRPAGADRRARGDEGARPLARRPAPRDPGAARLGEDVDVGAADRRPDRARQPRRRRLDEPQGDPQPGRGGRGGCGRDRARLQGAEEGERRQSRVVLRGRAGRERRPPREDCVDCDLAAGTAWLFSNERHDGDARLPLRRRGRAGLARGRARDGHGGAQSRPRRRPAAARPGAAGDASRRQRRVGAEAPARRRRDRPARPRPLPRAHVPAPSGHLRATSRRSSTRVGSSRRRGSGADDAVRDGAALPRGRARPPTGRSRRRRSRSCAPRSSGCAPRA